MARLVWADWKATISQISTHYSQDEQTSILENTVYKTLRFMGNNSERPNQVPFLSEIWGYSGHMRTKTRHLKIGRTSDTAFLSAQASIVIHLRPPLISSLRSHISSFCCLIWTCTDALYLYLHNFMHFIALWVDCRAWISRCNGIPIKLAIKCIYVSDWSLCAKMNTSSAKCLWKKKNWEQFPISFWLR